MSTGKAATGAESPNRLPLANAALEGPLLHVCTGSPQSSDFAGGRAMPLVICALHRDRRKLEDSGATVHQDARLRTLFSSPAAIADPQPSPPGTVLRNLGRALLYFSAFFLLLGSYMEFTQYWIQARWIRADAKVLSVKVYESVDASGRRGNKSSYGSRLRISYQAAGENRQSEIDSGPAFTNIADAGSYAAHFSFGRRISIFYKPSDPSIVQLQGDPPPTYITASQILQIAGFLFLAGVLVKFALMQEPRREAT